MDNEPMSYWERQTQSVERELEQVRSERDALAQQVAALRQIASIESVVFGHLFEEHEAVKAERDALQQRLDAALDTIAATLEWLRGRGEYRAMHGEGWFEIGERLARVLAEAEQEASDAKD